MHEFSRVVVTGLQRSVGKEEEEKERERTDGGGVTLLPSAVCFLCLALNGTGLQVIPLLGKKIKCESGYYEF